MDIKLDGADDLDFETTPNDVTLLSGVEAVRQHWLIRMRHVRGEWFKNRKTGVPFYEQVFIKGVSASAITYIFRKVTLDTPGIATLDRFSLTLDRPTRRASVFASGVCDPKVAEGKFEFVYNELLFPQRGVPSETGV